MPKRTSPAPGLTDTWGRRNRVHADRLCRECGKQFHPGSAEAKYCSRPCMWKNNGRNQGEKPKEELTTQIRRFWNQVDKSGECWLWTGTVDHTGYGQFQAARRRYKAHRLAYILAHGTIPSHLELDHLCRTPACVRVDHLEAVTHQVNIQRGYEARAALEA